MLVSMSFHLPKSSLREKIPSYPPFYSSASLRKINGPFVMIAFTTITDRTTTNTEQKAKQNWHLCRPISVQECFTKKRNEPQQVRDPPKKTSSSKSSSMYYVCSDVALLLKVLFAYEVMKVFVFDYSNDVAFNLNLLCIEFV